PVVFSCGECVRFASRGQRPAGGCSICERGSQEKMLAPEKMVHSYFRRKNFVATVLWMTAALATLLALPLPAPARNLSGGVKNASGEIAGGAFVKIRNTASHFTFMVISQKDGRYRSPELPPGPYLVQAIGGGFQSEAPTSLLLGGDESRTVDLLLKSPQKIN